jgi:glycosyltransferase involved in cell wall biosynthesis
MTQIKKSFYIPELSVFFPAYNEEKNIEKTVEGCISILKDITPKWEVVIIDDGSKDNTGKISQKLADKYKGLVRVITHRPNRGYGGALKSGLYGCKYDWIAFTDSDGQFDFGEIYHFIDTAKTQKADLVIGYRIKREDPLLRIAIANMLKVWNFIFYGSHFKDADCGFKLVKKEVIDKIPPLQTESAITETEFLIRAKKAGFKIVEIGVRHFPRKEGSQTGGNPKVILKAAKESINLWKALH